MVHSKNHSPSELNELMKYDSCSGKIFWRSRARARFSSDRAFNTWNSKYAGKEAGSFERSLGYRRVAIDGRAYRSHRVIWAMVHGRWPLKEIDHINGVRDDNRIENLRDVDVFTNRKNSAVPYTNTSGVMGVSWHKKTEKWRATIRRDGESLHLGLFPSKKEAVIARQAAEKALNFHPNHGRPQ